MTHKDIYTKFMIEYDKANVTSSYPSLTQYEVATLLDKAYLALIARKFTGNNPRQQAFETDIKGMSDLQPLVVHANPRLSNAGRPAENVKSFLLPGDYLYYVLTSLKRNIQGEPMDGINNRTIPAKLVPHELATKFFVTPYNMPWVKNPVCYQENGKVFVVYDPVKSPDSLNADFIYIKYPKPFVLDVPTAPIYEDDDNGDPSISDSEHQGGHEADVVKVKAPTINGNSTFTVSASITISQEDGADIYYSIGADSNPKTNGIEYTEPIEINDTNTVIKAVAVKDGVYSAIVSRTFTRLTENTGGEEDPQNPNNPGGGEDPGNNPGTGGGGDTPVTDNTDFIYDYQRWSDNMSIGQETPIRDTDLNHYIIFDQLTSHSGLCVDSSKEIKFGYWDHANLILRTGHFVDKTGIYTVKNIETGEVVLTSQGTLCPCAEVLWTEPIRHGDLRDDTYGFIIPEATIGDANFGKWLAGEPGITKGMCHVNPRTPVGIFTISADAQPVRDQGILEYDILDIQNNNTPVLWNDETDGQGPEVEHTYAISIGDLTFTGSNINGSLYYVDVTTTYDGYEIPYRFMMYEWEIVNESDFGRTIGTVTGWHGNRLIITLYNEPPVSTITLKVTATSESYEGTAGLTTTKTFNL